MLVSLVVTRKITFGCALLILFTPNWCYVFFSFLFRDYWSLFEILQYRSQKKNFARFFFRFSINNYFLMFASNDWTKVLMASSVFYFLFYLDPPVKNFKNLSTKSLWLNDWTYVSVVSCQDLPSPILCNNGEILNMIHAFNIFQKKG